MSGKFYSPVLLPQDDTVAAPSEWPHAAGSTSINRINSVIYQFNPIMSNGIYHPYQLDQSIAVSRVVVW